MQFLQVVQNPALAPFARMDYIVREIAKSMDLDPDKVGNNMAQAAVQAEILKSSKQLIHHLTRTWCTTTRWSGRSCWRTGTGYSR